MSYRSTAPQEMRKTTKKLVKFWICTPFVPTFQRNRLPWFSTSILCTQVLSTLPYASSYDWPIYTFFPPHKFSIHLQKPSNSANWGGMFLWMSEQKKKLHGVKSLKVYHSLNNNRCENLKSYTDTSSPRSHSLPGSPIRKQAHLTSNSDVQLDKS